MTLGTVFSALFRWDRDLLASAMRSTMIDPKYLLRKSKRAIMQRYADRYATGDLIDLGCGSAEFRPLFEGKINAYIQFDYPVTQQSMGYGEMSIDVAGDVRSIPMAAECVDSILLLDVLEHVWEVDSVLWSLSRILKPGGTLLLTTPFIYPVHGKPYDYHRFSFYALEKHLGRHGLEIVNRSVVGGYGTVLAVLTNQFLLRTFLGNVRLFHVVGVLLRPLWLAAIVALNCLGYVLDVATQRRPTWVYLENAVICEKR